MKVVSVLSEVDENKCDGCRICEWVCPTEAIVVNKVHIAKVDASICLGCENCASRCPQYAIEMVDLDKSKVVYVDYTRVPYDQIMKLCRKAHFNPQQVLCFCTGTRAREVAASILLGANTPEEISRNTGIRTGCTVECHQPILRLLRAADVKLGKAPGLQWYGITVTAWDISKEMAENPEYKQFHFDEDKKFMDSVVESQNKEVNNEKNI